MTKIAFLTPSRDRPDDLRYISYWDEILLNVTQQIKDNIYCCWFDDSTSRAEYCDFPMVSRQWYKILGYFTPEIFMFGYNDVWIYDMAKAIKRAFYIPEVKISHERGTKPMDNTAESNVWKYNFDAFTFQHYQPRLFIK